MSSQLGEAPPTGLARLVDDIERSLGLERDTHGLGLAPDWAAAAPGSAEPPD